MFEYSPIFMYVFSYNIVCACICPKPCSQKLQSIKYILYSYNNLPILLDDVTCYYYDDYLLECSHDGIGTHNCGHNEDIELTCSIVSTVFTVTCELTITAWSCVFDRLSIYACTYIYIAVS